MDAILRFGMDDGHRNALQQPQGHETFLVIPERSSSNVKVAPSNTRLASTKSNPWSFRFRLRLTSSHVNRIA